MADNAFSIVLLLGGLCGGLCGCLYFGIDAEAIPFAVCSLVAVLGWYELRA